MPRMWLLSATAGLTLGTHVAVDAVLLALSGLLVLADAAQLLWLPAPTAAAPLLWLPAPPLLWLPAPASAAPLL